MFPSANERTFYEDGLVKCFLEQYPRNPGHTIILLKPHFEDVSGLPPALGSKISQVIHAATQTLKAVVKAEKVYPCTMCDGVRNHLHFQLIPRLEGDTVTGSKLFVNERRILRRCDGIILD